MEDIEISRSILKEDIVHIADKVGISEDQLILYGHDKAKVKETGQERKGKLILVTAINPTPYGEGKTTVSIGLCDAFRRLDRDAILALREPSMGPVFGVKGGATGGGYSQVVPMEDINLHFTGDFAAIESANNLLCAAIDNHIAKGNELGFAKISFKRCLDVNDRSLRVVQTMIGETGFNITAASEMMALFCLARSLSDLKSKLGNIIVGYTGEGQEIYARDLKIEGALTVLLKDAFYPNLVQTLEHSPALIHGGPFANIAHGCNSLVATDLGLRISDYVITEAGFGSDLGAEKFFDIKCRKGNLHPDCVVLVATIKALKYNAFVPHSMILSENVERVREGLANLKIHIENMKKYNSNLVVCLNQYDTDTPAEVDAVRNFCLQLGVPFEVSSAYREGGSGAISLAQVVLRELEKENDFHFLYDLEDSLTTKIEKVAKEIYRASDVVYSNEALEKIQTLQGKGFGDLPICIAKTQYSISDDCQLLGAPTNHTLHIRDVHIYHGAGFITVLAGNIMTMPGLPTHPNYEKIDYVNDKVIGLS